MGEQRKRCGECDNCKLRQKALDYHKGKLPYWCEELERAPCKEWVGGDLAPTDDDAWLNEPERYGTDADGALVDKPDGRNLVDTLRHRPLSFRIGTVMHQMILLAKELGGAFGHVEEPDPKVMKELCTVTSMLLAAVSVRPPSVEKADKNKTPSPMQETNREAPCLCNPLPMGGYGPHEPRSPKGQWQLVEGPSIRCVLSTRRVQICACCGAVYIEVQS